MTSKLLVVVENHKTCIPHLYILNSPRFPVFNVPIESDHRQNLAKMFSTGIGLWWYVNQFPFNTGTWQTDG